MTGDTGQQIDTDHDKGAGFVDVWVETGGIRARRHYGCTARQHLLGSAAASAITAAAKLCIGRVMRRSTMSGRVRRTTAEGTAYVPSTGICVDAKPLKLAKKCSGK